MDAIVGSLIGNDIDVLRLSLRGHGDNFTRLANNSEAEARLQALSKVTYGLWCKEMLDAYDYVRQRSRQAGHCPIFLVGFSLGAVLGCDLMLSAPTIRFDRLLLFAPAFKLHPYTYLPRLLSPFPRFIVPSVSPVDYRSNRGTSIAAYCALFASITRFHANLDPESLNIPTLIFVDSKDELVSYKALHKMIENKELTKWQLETVVKDQSARKLYHHLVINADCVGSERWTGMMRRAMAHLLC